MRYIHPTAIIYPNVHIGNNVFIGAYSVIGAPPEHPDEVNPREWSPKYEGATVIIHDHVVIRENVTVNAGYLAATWIGWNCYLMAHSHVGHDVVMFGQCTLHTGATIGGHSKIAQHSRIGLNATLHQHSDLAVGTMVGAQAFVKGKWNKRFRILAGVPAKDIGPNQRLIDKLGIIQ